MGSTATTCCRCPTRTRLSIAPSRTFAWCATRSIAAHALLFEEFLAREHAAGRLKLALAGQPGQSVLLHGHCHQKAFGAMSAVQQSLALVPGLEVKTIESSCCGMAGAFGYEAEHHEVSMRMGLEMS